MSDYGFATYDEKTGRVAMKINSKWPVFGPEYSKIAKEFKTVSLVDAKENTVKTASLSVPGYDYNFTGYGESYDIYYGESVYATYVDQTVYRYEHGLGFRPLGYYTISGKLNRVTKVQLTQSNVKGGADYGGSFTVNANFTSTGVCTPIRGGMRQADTDTWMWVYNQIVPMSLSNGGVAGTNVIIPDACLGVFSSWANRTDLHYNMYSEDFTPYRVEIDDKEVKIIKRYCWADHLVRAGYQDGSLDVRQRTKAIENYAGTTLDITIYLVPYSLEDVS